MKGSISLFLKTTSVLTVTAAIALQQIQRTTWWAGYDARNCPGCRPVVDWSIENAREAVTDELRRDFVADGVVVLRSAISAAKVATLSHESDGMDDTFLTAVLTRTVLRQYEKYEHRLDTRSELVRDWAVHGPLGKWAARLMDVEEVRLYNAEKIYSAGTDNPSGCASAWHRDTIAAPFPPGTKSLTFNVYLDDISADGPHGDVLVYVRGSHRDLDAPPSLNHVFRPTLAVGDVLVHHPDVFHSPSGHGCWNRRSLQFRYVESPTVFTFPANRFPHGPIPWTFAHAPGVAPHGLGEGDALGGPWYPKVYPGPEEGEHVGIGGPVWGIVGMLAVGKRAIDEAERLGIGEGENCTAGGRPGGEAYFGFDGPVHECKDWEMAYGVPVHKDGQMIKTVKKSMGETLE